MHLIGGHSLSNDSRRVWDLGRGTYGWLLAAAAMQWMHHCADHRWADRGSSIVFEGLRSC